MEYRSQILEAYLTSSEVIGLGSE